MEDQLDLNVIRRTLMRLEDTIIFLLIERAQFAHNPDIYIKSSWVLKQTEITHAKVRRYDSPDEYPFTPSDQLPKPILPPLEYPVFLYPNKINLNGSIKQFYIHQIVPELTRRPKRPEDDGHYGSSATRDVEILQAVSRRIHYGKFVAESKFRDKPSAFIEHIQARNEDALEQLITKPAVEAALIRRLEKKALTYGQEITGEGEPVDCPGQCKLDAQVVVKMYKDWVIPLTRTVEVEYLLVRLDGLSQEEIQDLMK